MLLRCLSYQAAILLRYGSQSPLSIETEEGKRHDENHHFGTPPFFITSEHHVSHHFRTQPKNRTSWLLTGAALWEVTRSKAMCVPKKGAI